MLTLFCHDFVFIRLLYLASKIMCILCVEIIVLSDSRHLLAYELIKDSSGLTIFSVKDLNL